MQDITQLIFEANIWLAVGVVLYYALTVAKVFLLTKIQPAIIYGQFNKRLKAISIVSKFIKAFFSDSLLHKMTFAYLFGGDNEEKWKLLEIKSIKFYYGLLDALTSMLKPFMIIAIIWSILKFIYLRRIMYDEMQITLGEIQILISYLKGNTFVNWFETWKWLIFIGIIIMFAFLGLVKKYEENIKSAKSIISMCFTVLGILGGLSFFGDNLGKTVNAKLNGLRELDFKVRDIHENIYHTVAQAIVYQDLAQAVSEDIINRKKELARHDSLSKQASKVITDVELHTRLANVISARKDKLAEENVFTVDFDGPHLSKVKTINDHVFSEHMSSYFKKLNSTNNTYNDRANYWENSDNWNKKTGLKYEESANNLRRKAWPVGSAVSENISASVFNIIDFALDEFLGFIVKRTAIEKLELPKAISSYVIIEKCKECFAPKIAEAILSLGNPAIALAKIKNFACFKRQGDSKVRDHKLRLETDRFYNRELAVYKSEQLKIDANQKIDDMIKSKIERITADFVPNNSQMYDEFTGKVIEKYKQEIRFDKLPDERYKQIVASADVATEVIARAMSGSVVSYHPFPRAGCPICAFVAVRSLKGRN
jgi:hypothetical protein